MHSFSFKCIQFCFLSWNRITSYQLIDGGGHVLQWPHEEGLVIGASQEVVDPKDTVQSLAAHAELKHVGSAVEVSVACRTQDPSWQGTLARDSEIDGLDEVELTSVLKSCCYFSSHARKGPVHPLWESLVHSLFDFIIAEQQKINWVSNTLNLCK